MSEMHSNKNVSASFGLWYFIQDIEHYKPFVQQHSFAVTTIFWLPQVQVGFCLTEQLLEKVARPPADDVSCHVDISDTGERTLRFNTDLRIVFSNESIQVSKLCFPDRDMAGEFPRVTLLHSI